MRSVHYQAEVQLQLAEAEAVLGGPARPARLDWELQQSLIPLLKLEDRRGLGKEPPLLYFDGSKRGHMMATGVERYRWDAEDGPLRLVKIVFPNCVPLDDFWAVRTEDYRRFYRLLRRHLRAGELVTPPILPPATERRLWENSVGFLRRGHA